MRLIDADELNKVKFHPLPYTHIVPADLLKCQTEAYERGWNDAIDAIMENAPTVDAEPTEEQVKEYCRKRCLVIVNSELFNEMKARWGRETVKHGHWELSPFDGNWTCNKCGNKPYHSNMKNMNYCPNCGAKMEEEDETD